METKAQRGSAPCGGGDLNWGIHAKSCSSEDTGIACPAYVFQRLVRKARKRGQQWQVSGLLARGGRGAKLPKEGLRHMQIQGKK